MESAQMGIGNSETDDGPSSPRTLMEWALYYASIGWPVFPLHDKGKTPRTVRGFKDASTDPATIKSWWTRWPAANIGIPTGEASGLAVVDIDPRHGGDVSLEALTEKHGALPDTIESLTGNHGFHKCFQWVTGFRNSAGQIAPGIDTRGEGGYIVAPPSVHPNGNEYQWEASSGPDVATLAPLPPFLMLGTMATLPKPDGAGNLNFDASNIQMKASGEPVKEGGRNNALASLAGQWVTAGDSVAEVIKKAKEWNATNKPPMPAGEVDRTVGSIIKTHLNNNPAASVSVVPAEPVELDILIDEPHEQPAPKKFPARLLAAPGFVGEICNWIDANAIKPQPVLTLANTLAFFGAVIGRKVATPSDLRTNLYCLGVGDSGCGKDHSRKCIKRICDAVGLTETLLGGEDVSSDTAILGAVFEKPTILFQFDEIGHMLANTSSKYAQSHQRAIAPLLTKLFSSANTRMLGKEFANRKENRRRDIDQPNVCLYGTTVPGRLYDGLSSEEIRDGFLGRMLVFQSDEPDPMERTVIRHPVPQGIINMVQAWHDRKDMPKADGNVAELRDHLPMTVPFEPDAEAEMVRFNSVCRERKAATRGHNGLDALWSRGVEHASKVALTIACGCEFSSPVVSGDVASYATGLVEYLIGALLEAVEDSVSSSEHESNLLYVQRAIKSAGQHGLTLSELTHRTRKLTARTRQEILNDLVVSTRVNKGQRKGSKGPAAMVYVYSVLLL